MNRLRTFVSFLLISLLVTPSLMAREHEEPIPKAPFFCGVAVFGDRDACRYHEAERRHALELGKLQLFLARQVFIDARAEIFLKAEHPAKGGLAHIGFNEQHVCILPCEGERHIGGNG